MKNKLLKGINHVRIKRYSRVLPKLKINKTMWNWWSEAKLIEFGDYTIEYAKKIVFEPETATYRYVGGEK